MTESKVMQTLTIKTIKGSPQNLGDETESDVSNEGRVQGPTSRISSPRRTGISFDEGSSLETSNSVFVQILSQSFDAFDVIYLLPSLAMSLKFVNIKLIHQIINHLKFNQKKNR